MIRITVSYHSCHGNHTTPIQRTCQKISKLYVYMVVCQKLPLAPLDLDLDNNCQSPDYRGTQRPPFPQSESQHNSFKVLCCKKIATTQQFKTVVLWLALGKRWPLCTTVPDGYFGNGFLRFRPVTRQGGVLEHVPSLRLLLSVSNFQSFFQRIRFETPICWFLFLSDISVWFNCYLYIVLLHKKMFWRYFRTCVIMHRYWGLCHSLAVLEWRNVWVSVNTTSAPSATCLCRLPQPPPRNRPAMYSFFAQKWYGLLSFWALSWLRARMLLVSCCWLINYGGCRWWRVAVVFLYQITVFLQQNTTASLLELYFNDSMQTVYAPAVAVNKERSPMGPM